MRQVSVDKLFSDNREKLGLVWRAGRQGGNRVLTGESALKPTIGQVGHMNFIHPFRVQMVGAFMWVVYGLLISATPVVAANLLVFGAAVWGLYSEQRRAAV